MLVFLLSLIEDERDQIRFRQIYDQFNSMFFRITRQYLRDPQDVEDAVQNTYVQVIRHFQKAKTLFGNDLEYWLISILKNEALQIVRKHKKRSMQTVLEDWNAFEETNLHHKMDYEQLVYLISKMPETYRAAMEMRFLIGYTNPEIARKLGLTTETVAARLSRGRKLLHAILEKEGIEL